MILIIDAYNVLKYSLGNHAITERERQGFIHQLQRYVQKRGLQSIVVFDGGPDRWPLEHQYHMITVVYAGSGESADSYIQHHISRNAHKELVLVSSDNALADFAQHYTVPSIDASLFVQILERSKHTKRVKHQSSSVSAIKLSDDDNPDLDNLMLSSTVPPNKDTDNEAILLMEQSGKQISKTDRILLKIVKKLL